MKTLVYILILVPLIKKLSKEILVISSLISLSFSYFSWDHPMVLMLSIMGDQISVVLSLMTLLIITLMHLVNVNNNIYINYTMNLLLMCLLMFFFTSSLITFFIMFEVSLIPTLGLILGWGYQPERVEASYYFFFYTAVFSLPMMICLLMILQKEGKYFYSEIPSEKFQGILGLYMLLVFMIKLPMFMFHFWLPKAHLEAPLVGSMILAGVLLKTGGYGVVRLYKYLDMNLVSNLMMSLSIVGMVLVCLICLFSSDLKQVVAYSSVSHMNFMASGLLNGSILCNTGGFIMMISHGICSSLMFLISDLVYKRTNTRSLIFNKGLLVLFPILSLWWGLTMLYNMGFPPTPGSLSEIMIIMGTSTSFPVMVMYMSYLFLSAFYSMSLYMQVCHGSNLIMTSNSSLSIKEILSIVLHIVPLSSVSLLNSMLM